jgi:hypothetical protein
MVIVVTSPLVIGDVSAWGLAVSRFFLFSERPRNFVDGPLRLFIGSWIIVVELLLLICAWEFNTKQKLNKKEQAFAFTGLKQYYINKNG